VFDKFFHWVNLKIKITLGFLVITHVLQIPHFIWGGDAIVKSGHIYDVYIGYDLFLYSIDLIEIPALFAVVLAFIAKMKGKPV